MDPRIAVAAIVIVGCCLSGIIPLLWVARLEKRLYRTQDLLREANGQVQRAEQARNAAEQDVARWRNLYLAERRSIAPDERRTLLRRL